MVYDWANAGDIQQLTVLRLDYLSEDSGPPSPAFITGKTGLVLNVYTKPEHRRMELLMEDAGKMGLRVVELKATEAGYGMYAALGFEESGSKYRAMRWTPERYRE